jgi:hypothetical protein
MSSTMEYLHTTSGQEYPCNDDLVQNENARLVREAGILVFTITDSIFASVDLYRYP